MIIKIIIIEFNKETGINNPTYIQTNSLINTAISEQQQIGWIQLMCGFFSQKWQDAQEAWIQIKLPNGNLHQTGGQEVLSNAL